MWVTCLDVIIVYNMCITEIEHCSQNSIKIVSLLKIVGFDGLVMP